MQINIHIPRSAIRQSYKEITLDPFNAYVTNAIGAYATVGTHATTIEETGEVIPNPRSLKRAVWKYMDLKLDSPVRFRLTIPDEVKSS